MHCDVWSASAFAIAVVIAGYGCSKEPNGTSGSSPGPSSAGQSSSAAGEGSSGDEVSMEVAAESFDQLKQLMETQLASVEAQVRTLSRAAVVHNDAQLTAMVDTFKAKAAELRAALDRLTFPADIRTIQEDLPRMLSDAAEMGAAATGRLQDVLRAKNGGSA